MTAHRIRGRSDGNMKRDDATHRATLTAILEPKTAQAAGKLLGITTETCSARLRKYQQHGLARLIASRRCWEITQAGRTALASDALISLGVRREDPPKVADDDVWTLLLGARRPEKVTGRYQGKMRMGAPV